MSAQLRLSLERDPSHAPGDFVVSASNAAAVQALERWPDWRGGALVLTGPPGSGKTHLARMWATRHAAAILHAEALDAATADGPVLVEDADAGVAEEALFHLINRAGRPGASLLLTACTAPGLWPSRLPDLRSRLNALPVAALEEPDDTVLAAMLDKFFRERNIRPSPELLAYLLRRIERSAQSAADVVARMDEAADLHRRPVSRSLARLVLGEEAETPVDPATAAP